MPMSHTCLWSLPFRESIITACISSASTLSTSPPVLVNLYRVLLRERNASLWRESTTRCGLLDLLVEGGYYFYNYQGFNLDVSYIYWWQELWQQSQFLTSWTDLSVYFFIFCILINELSVITIGKDHWTWAKERKPKKSQLVLCIAARNSPHGVPPFDRAVVHCYALVKHPVQGLYTWL